ncbi:MAG: phosphatidylcholine/phosphatidylserine synthase [Planctomycetota bacterium]
MGFRLPEPSEDDAVGSAVAAGDPTSATPGRRADGRRRRRRKMRARTIAVLPTMFTLANLLCGFLAIFIASRPIGTAMAFDWTPLFCAAWFIFLGLICDALDGRVARLTRSTSDLGEQLDSMADMVTFGVAPAFILVQIIGVQAPFVSEIGDTFYDRLGLVVACIYVACAGLRLARFNIEKGDDEDTGGHLFFDGLPSPGAAGAVAGLALLHQDIWAHDKESLSAGIAAYVMLGAGLLCAVAMVSRFRYVHLMNRYVRGRAPFPAVVAGVIVLLLLLIWPQPAIAGGFVAYAVSGPATALLRKNKRTARG